MTPVALNLTIIVCHFDPFKLGVQRKHTGISVKIIVARAWLGRG